MGERKVKRGGVKYRGMVSTAAGIAKEEVGVYLSFFYYLILLYLLFMNLGHFEVKLGFTVPIHPIRPGNIVR